MKGKRTPSRREDGQILAIFAGALVALILISGLVIDGGNVFVTRRDSQDSADRIFERLVAWVPKNNVLMDVDKRSIVRGLPVKPQLERLVKLMRYNACANS